MDDQQDLVDVPFPAQGIDVSVELDRQPPGTTPIAVNVRLQDLFHNRQRGGSREGLVKYGGQVPAGSVPFQNLTQLVDPRDQLVIGSFEDFEPDFVPDPRNPARFVPPEGSGEPIALNWPPAAFRRVQVVAGATSVSVASFTKLNVTLTNQPANTTVPGITSVVFQTIPPGRTGDGVTLVLTNGVGSLPVADPNPEQVLYLAAHTYTEPGYLLPLVARGIAQVTWTPDLQISLNSPDGTMLDADGKSHPLVATLTKISDGSVVPNKLTRLYTTPSGEVGYGAGAYSLGDGTVTFTVSDVNDETVAYQAFTPPPVVTSNVVSIQWGAIPYQFTNNTKTTGVLSSTTITAAFAQSTAGHLIVVGIMVEGGAGTTITSVTDSLGTSYSQVNTVNDGVSLFGYVWAGKPTVSGANTITVTIGQSPASAMALYLDVGEYSKKVSATPAAVKANLTNYSTPTSSFVDDAGQLAAAAVAGHLYVGFVRWNGALLVSSSSLSSGFTIHDTAALGSGNRLSILDSVNPSTPISGAVRPVLSYVTSVPVTRADLIMTQDFPPAP